MIAHRFIPRGGTGGFVGGTFPSSWGVSRYGSNPIITVNPGNPAESVEQYTPAPIRVANGDYWVYVKGANRIYAWTSTDGTTYTLANGGTGVLLPAGGSAWDSTFAIEPAAIYDIGTDTIHLYYKGVNAGATDWGWGHATASGSSPTSFTRDPANPIYSHANGQADLGGSALTDFAPSDVIMIGSTFHFYGYALYNSIYRLVEATGTTWNNPSGATVILSAANSSGVVEVPAVVKIPGASPHYALWYSRGTATQTPVSIRVGSSTDGVTWDFSDTTDVLAAASGWESAQAYAGHFLKDPTPPYSYPLVSSGQWRFYYSGENGSNQDQTGFTYLTPS